MTPHTEILLIYASPQPSREMIQTMHAWLLQRGAAIEVGRDYYYCLGFIEGEDYDCHDTLDAEATLEKIAAWPQAGFLHYNILGTSFLVSFHAIADFFVGGVYFSAWEPEYQWNPVALDRLLHELNAELGTLCMLKGDSFTEEMQADDIIVAVQEGVFQRDCYPVLAPCLDEYVH